MSTNAKSDAAGVSGANDQSPTTSRPRGAPKGNQNALKHGFYSAQFNRADHRDLDKRQETVHSYGLADEIALLRVYMRRVVALAQEAEDYAASQGCDPETRLDRELKVLRCLSHAGIAIARLTRANHLTTGGEQQDMLQLLHAAIKDLETEWGIDLTSDDPSPAPVGYTAAVDGIADPRIADTRIAFPDLFAAEPAPSAGLQTPASEPDPDTTPNLTPVQNPSPADCPVSAQPLPSAAPTPPAQVSCKRTPGVYKAPPPRRGQPPGVRKAPTPDALPPTPPNSVT